eukprot:7076481-Karenia_brevis.AAC.1
MTVFQPVPMPAISANRGRRKANAQTCQATAYVAWKERCTKDWWQSKLSKKNTPNDKQRELINRIINRSRQEFQSFLRPNETQYQDDPSLDSLLGIPGAGKKHLYQAHAGVF